MTESNLAIKYDNYVPLHFVTGITMLLSNAKRTLPDEQTITIPKYKA
ncbi:9427_t:CDS:2 [Diversispora eburnea]|uniref:9427_t:CDS:1 n=1 Tax=Diversispora eburnea TaxID=1213867 RepID=A0A9N8WFJ8_9GLOM|nr:9427_t:CDS:2 [Diversispora eburnea]